ncbi:hypothetical protein [Xanthomonas sp. NCPPB 2632]|uniref:hypothetical protein n=1 Tax=Xanthomonas sp. NCPPB 2632 TaxID=3240912 RepID=UPI003516E95D
MPPEASFSRPLVIDEFVEVATVEFQRLFRGQVWSFGWKSNAKTDRYPYWHRHFIELEGRSETKKNKYPLGRFPVVDELWNRVQTAAGGQQARLLRAYANGLTYGLEGKIHTDSTHENDITAIIYTNEFWADAWAGETVFFLPGRETLAVTPVPGRLVLFNGTIPHVARSPSRDCPVLRTTLMYKLRLESHE